MLMDKKSTPETGHDTDDQALNSTRTPFDAQQRGISGCAGISHTRSGEAIVYCYGTCAEDPQATANQLVDLAARIVEKAALRKAA